MTNETKTLARAEIVRLYRKHQRLLPVARELGCCAQTVANHLKAAGEPRNLRGRPSVGLERLAKRLEGGAK